MPAWTEGPRGTVSGPLARPSGRCAPYSRDRTCRGLSSSASREEHDAHRERPRRRLPPAWSLASAALHTSGPRENGHALLLDGSARRRSRRRVLDAKAVAHTTRPAPRRRADAPLASDPLESRPRIAPESARALP